MKTIVLSLGGSLIVPDKIDYPFLKKFRELILSFVKRGNKVIIVCGGGKTCRKYNSAAEKIVKVPFDPIATKIARKLKLKVAFISGKNIKSLNDFLSGRKFKGSLVE
jgi:uridylate kinase